MEVYLRRVYRAHNIKALAQYEAEGIAGAIAGRAIYEGTLDFKDALKAARGAA